MNDKAYDSREFIHDVIDDYMESWVEICNYIPSADRTIMVISDTPAFKNNVSLYTQTKSIKVNKDHVKQAASLIHQVVGTQVFVALMVQKAVFGEIITAVMANMSHLRYSALNPALYVVKIIVDQIAVSQGPANFDKHIDKALKMLGYDRSIFAGMNAVYLEEMIGRTVICH